jgi:hypothetical protein
VRERAAGEDEQLEGVVEHRRVAEPLGFTIGRIFWMSSPKTGLSNSAWRACIQLMLPRRVLISPLWAR